jgi:hypothetical protein
MLFCVQVLLELCRHTGGANLVRRRFLQLKVLDFLMRELSLEHALQTGQQHGLGGSSCATTPASTARSSVRSTFGALTARGRGMTAAATAAAPAAAAAAGVGGAMQADAEAAEDALTERGVSGLLSSSLSSLSVAREAEQQQQQQQNSSRSCAPVAEEGVRTPAAKRQAAASVDADGDACSFQPPQAKQAAVSSLHSDVSTSSGHSNAESAKQLAMPAEAGNSHSSPPRMCSVLSRVQKFEAAAAAAAQAKAALVEKSPQRLPPPGRQPGSGCVVSVNVGVAAAAASSCKALRTPQPPSEEGPGVVLGFNRARLSAAGLVGQGSGLSSSGGGSKDSSVVEDRRNDSAADEASGTVDLSSSHETAEDQQPAVGPDDNAEDAWAWSEDMGSESESLSPGSSSPSHQFSPDRQRLGSSSSEADSRMQPIRGAAVRPVIPRLAFGMPASPAPAAAAVTALAVVHSDDASDGGDCRPGFDLEEDFRRMMDEEEAGMQGNWDFSSEYEDSGSECSSLIAAGRDVCDVEEEQQPPPAARSKPVLPPLRSLAALPGLGSSCVSACCHDGSSDTLSNGDFNSRLQLCGAQCSGSSVAAVATPVTAGLPRTAAQSAVPYAAAAAEASASANHYEDVCVEDAVGLHEEQHVEEGELEAHDDGDMLCERCAREMRGSRMGLHASRG